MVKRALKIFFSIIILLMTAIIVIPFVVDVNKLKKPLIQKIEQAMNVHATVDNLEMHVFPVPSLVLNHLKLVSVEGPFTDQLLLDMASSRLTLDLKNIFSKKIAMALTLNQPSLYYRTQGDSQDNTKGLIKDQKSEASSSSVMENIEVTSFSIERGVVYRVANASSEENKKSIVKDMDLDIDHFSLSPHERQNIGFTLKTLLNESTQPVHLTGHLEVDPDKKTYDTQDTVLHLGPTECLLKFNFEQKKDDYHYDIKISSDSLDFKSIALLSPSLQSRMPADAQINGQASLSLSASGTQADMQTSGFLNFEKSKIVYGNYFKKGDQIPAKISWSYYGPPQTLLTSGVLKGKMEWQDFFVLEKYEPENFLADFHLSGSKLILDSMTFKLFDGAMSGSGSVNFGEKIPEWQFDLKAHQLDFNSLMSVVGGFRDVFSGKGDFSILMSGHGSEIKDIKQSATGQGSLTIGSGKINTLNFAKEVLGPALVEGLNKALTIASLGAGGAPKISLPRFAVQTQETPFNSFIGGFHVENGFLQLPDMKISSDAQTIGLSGKTSLDGDLDLKGILFLSRQETDQWLGDFQGKSSLIDNEGHLPVPFTVTGGVLTPLIQPDVSAMTDKVKNSLTQNVQQKVEEKIPQKIPEILQNPAEKLKEVLH